MTSQAAYFMEKLRVCGLGETDMLRFADPAGELTLSVTDFIRWFREYGMSGTTLVESSEHRVGRLLVRPPGGGQPRGMPHPKP